MALLRRRSASDEAERGRLFAEIRNRGQADVDGASAAIAGFLSECLDDAGLSHEARANEWAWAQLRFFMVIGWSGYLKTLEPMSEYEQLRVEWAMLARDEGRFGPPHLLAWWWHLSPRVFGPVMQSQFDEMRGALTDGLRQASMTGFDRPTFDWNQLLDG